MIFFIICSSYIALAGDYSTINFVTTRTTKQASFKIYLNDQLIGTIGTKENLQYKMYSEGRITVTIVSGLIPVTSFIDVKKGATHYFELRNKFSGKYGLMKDEEGKNAFSKNKNTIHVEEDLTKPIGQLIIKHEEGPKQGTCFLISRKGYMFTNYHLVVGATRILIKGIDNDFATVHAAEVIATDAELDLALIRFKDTTLSFEKIPYKLSNEQCSPGSPAFVLGFPLTSSMGEEIKLTEGIISARSGFRGSISQYQFSAPVQPGNSGSPLFNDKGDVIGIINGKLNGAEAAGYAIKSQYGWAFLDLIEGLDIEKTSSSTGKLSLPDKVNKLKGFIFIIRTE